MSSFRKNGISLVPAHPLGVKRYLLREPEVAGRDDVAVLLTTRNGLDYP